MAKIYDPKAIGKFCEALGVERVDEVTRVVVDIRSGEMPMLYVERIGDVHTIVAALREPGIDVEFQAPAREVVHARDGAYWRRNRCGAEGGLATDDELATCPECRAAIEHEESARRPAQGAAGKPESKE